MGRNLFMYHPRIGYRFIPGIKARVLHEGGGYFFRTNSIGFRSIEIREKEKPRILVFGDSYTAGDGVSDQFRFTDILAAKLDAEVVNFGLPGTGTDQEYLSFLEFCEHLDYDLVIICPLAENIRRNRARYRLSKSGDIINARPKPYFILDGGRLLLKNCPVPKKGVPLEEIKEMRYVDQGTRFPGIRKILKGLSPSSIEHLQRYLGYQPYPEYDSGKDPGWMLMKAIIKEWVGKIKSRVIIAPLPTYHYIENLSGSRNFRKRWREFSEEIDADILDLLPSFWKLPNAQLRQFRFREDQHYTKAAHLFLAEMLLPMIERRLV